MSRTHDRMLVWGDGMSQSIGMRSRACFDGIGVEPSYCLYEQGFDGEQGGTDQGHVEFDGGPDGEGVACPC